MPKHDGLQVFSGAFMYSVPANIVSEISMKVNRDFALPAARVHKLFTESGVDILNSNDIILDIPILNYLKLEVYHA